MSHRSCAEQRTFPTLFNETYHLVGYTDNVKPVSVQQMDCQFKSKIYADLLTKPEEIVLYKPRKEGCLNVIHAKYRAMVELIKSFIDTPSSGEISYNKLCTMALHVENIRTIPVSVFIYQKDTK